MRARAIMERQPQAERVDVIRPRRVAATAIGVLLSAMLYATGRGWASFVHSLAGFAMLWTLMPLLACVCARRRPRVTPGYGLLVVLPLAIALVPFVFG